MYLFRALITPSSNIFIRSVLIMMMFCYRDIFKYKTPSRILQTCKDLMSLKAIINGGRSK